MEDVALIKVPSIKHMYISIYVWQFPDMHFLTAAAKAGIKRYPVTLEKVTWQACKIQHCFCFCFCFRFCGRYSSKY